MFCMCRACGFVWYVAVLDAEDTSVCMHTSKWRFCYRSDISMFQGICSHLSAYMFYISYCNLTSGDFVTTCAVSTNIWMISSHRVRVQSECQTNKDSFTYTGIWRRSQSVLCCHVGMFTSCLSCRHFQETNHTYAMQLGTNRVWDYAGDNYVHRLAQNKSDGKLVQVDEGGNAVQEEKLDSITLEVEEPFWVRFSALALLFL